jgi:hypothetical protein
MIAIDLSLEVIWSRNLRNLLVFRVKVNQGLNFVSVLDAGRHGRPRPTYVNMVVISAIAYIGHILMLPDKGW